MAETIALAQTSYTERILRRVIPLLVLVLIAFGVLTVFNVSRDAQNRLYDLHNSTLDRARLALETQMREYISAAQRLASEDRMLAYSAGRNRDETNALTAAFDLMRTPGNPYLAIRFVNRAGNIELEATNPRGQTLPQRTSEEVLRAQRLNFSSDQAFQRLMGGMTNEVVVGQFRLARNASGQVIQPVNLSFLIYSPVFGSGGTIAGLLQIEVDATRVLSLVDDAERSFVVPQTGRYLLLTNNSGSVVADSGTRTREHLAEIEASGGNANALPLYNAIVRMDRTQRDDFLLLLNETRVVSGQSLSFQGAAETGWRLFLVDDALNVYQLSISAALGIVFLSIVTGFGSVYVLRRLLTPVLEPVETASAMLQKANQGEALPAPSATTELTRAVQGVTTQVTQLNQALTEQTRRRSRDLQVAGRIGRETATLDDLDTLLRRAINLICNELGFYHAQVFLIDDLGQNAILAYSRGEAGRMMLERGHQIRVGSSSIVGTVTAEKRPVIVNDTQAPGHQALHSFNPLLPDTRAEMGLPLIAGDQVIGALDIQSTAPEVFLADDIPMYQLLADQIALAIYNARLKQQAERRFQQIDRLNRQLTREAWQKAEQDAQLETVYGQVPESKAVQAPIQIRGEKIGTLEVAMPEGSPLSEGDQIIVQAVAERMALAIENARLFEETQTSLAETSILYQLSQRLSDSAAMPDILHAIIRTVAPAASGGQIWLFNEAGGQTQPDIAQLHSDLALTKRPEDELIAPGMRLRLQDYPLLASLRSDQPSVIADVAQAASTDPLLLPILQGFGAGAIVFIPLNMRGEWKGLLTLTFEQARRFNEQEMRLYGALITQASAAIDNRLLQEQTEEALTRNEKLYAASRIINSISSLQDLVYAAVATSSNPALNFWLALLEGEAEEDEWPRRARLIARSENGVVEAVNRTIQVPISARSPLRYREPEVLVDPGEEITDVTRPVTWMRTLGQRFMAIFPLFVEDRPIALFYIVSGKVQSLSEEDFETYKAIAGQMSTQIQNRRLLERTEAALSETRRLYVASRAIASATEMSAVYDAIAGHLALPFLQRSNEETNISISVLLAQPAPRPDAESLELVFQWLSDPLAQPELNTGYLIQQIEAPFGSTLFESETGFLLLRKGRRDTTVTPLMRSTLLADEANAALAVSLQSRRDWYGVLIVRSTAPELIDDGYIRFVQAIADQVAVSIERQQLLAEAQTERENLSSILSTLPAGVIVIDPETFVPVQSNERAELLLGRPIDMTQPFSASHYELYRTGTNLEYPDEELPIRLALVEESAVFIDDVAVIHDGEQTDLLVNAAPIYDASGKLMGIVTAFQDISTLRNLENTLQENLRESVTLYETQRALTEAEDLESIYETLLMQMSLQQPSDAFILLQSEDQELETVRWMMEPLEDSTMMRPVLGETLQLVHDSQTEPKLNAEARAALSAAGVRSLISVPLRTQLSTRPLGWMLLVANEPNAFTAEQERTLDSIGDMASVAIDNKYLVASTQRALQETASLYSATTTISRSRDFIDLGEALSGAVQVLQPQFAGVYLVEGGQMQTIFEFGQAELLERGLDIFPLLSQTVRSADGFLAVQRGDDNPFGSALEAGDGLATLVVAELLSKDQSRGRLLLGYEQPRTISADDRRYISAIVDSAAVVIDNQVLLDQVQNSLQETSILYQASRALTEVNGPTDIQDVIVNYLIDPSVEQVFIALLNTPTWDASNAVVEVATLWQAEPDYDLRGVKLSHEQFPAWRLLTTDSVLMINDVQDEALGLDDMERMSLESLNSRSLVLIPLRVPSRAIGVVWISSRMPAAYDERNQRIFQAFAEQTSLSLEAARLLAQTERRAQQLITSATISQRIGQILDLDVLLPQVVELIKAQFRYDHVQIFLMDEQNEFALLRASTGEAGRQLLSIGHKLRRGSESVIGRVTQNNEPTIALDTAEANVVHRPNPYLPMTRSEMALPLAIKGRVVGALDVQSNQPNAFSDEDVQALTTLAAQISVAIDNARLYEETQRRANDLDFLFSLTTSAAAAETLGEALNTLVEELCRALRATSAQVYLPEIYEDFEENRRTVLHVMAAHSSAGTLNPTREILLGDSEDLISIVGLAQQPIIVPNIASEIRYYPAHAEAQSAIVVPISAGGELIGVISAENQRANAFDHSSQALLMTLAGSLAAIIQNAQLVSRLQETNERLREIDRLKSQFLASMSHELRTPLNSIIGFSRVMLKGIDGPLTEMQEQDLSTIYNSGTHLLNLINDILDQAKIEANELNLKFEYFDVKAVVDTVKSMGVGLIKEKSLDLIFETAPNLPKAYGDEQRTRQILLNLVSNAIKFTPQGGVHVVVYGVELDGHTFIRFDVTDSGIGIAEEDIPTVFERFRQVDSSLTRTVGGTGLGLPISKSLTELQGGEMTVVSEVNKGSTFSFTVPTEPVAEEAKPSHEPSSNGTPDPTPVSRITATRPSLAQITQQVPVLPTKRDVLLIEDNKDMVDQFRRALQREGFEVQTADHAAYAEAMVSQIRPTVVLLDVNFANGQGWELLRSLKERDDTFDIPIVVTTISGDSERAYRLGAHSFLQRPFTPDKLVEVILEAEHESNRERILIIDDQPETIRLLTQLLDEHGDFRVFSAESGAEGISLVARRRPNLIILDLRMPGMDGFAVLHELRANPETSSIPVLVVTGEMDFNASEAEQLSNLHVLRKTDISQEAYEQFIENVRNYLHARGTE